MMSEDQFSSALLPKTGSYEFIAEPFHCDCSNHLFLGHLGNAMLNAADFHCNDRQYGMSYLNTIHRTWVLSRLAIELERMPLAYEHFLIETWVEDVMRYFTNRNFAVKSVDGKTVYGYGRSVWAMIDMESRQPVNLLEVKDGLITEYIDKEKVCPIDKPGRVTINQEVSLARTIDTYYQDVDVNGHINSVKYIEHVLNLFGLDWYRTHFLKRFEIAYVAESHAGDKLNFYLQQNSDLDFVVRITKSTDEEVEVVRCLLNFVKD